MRVPGAAQRAAMPHFTNLGDLIRRDHDLDKVAIIDLGGNRAREVSYAELDALANAVARALCARGLARGERVAILSANRAEYLAVYYGILRAGLVAVPVSFKFPRSTIHFILRDADAKLVFCDMARAPDCPPDIPAVHFGDEGTKGFDRFLDGGPFDAIVPRPREPAMFLYTSGSTGMPKGVVLSHQSHIWVVETRLTDELERHRYLIAAPLYHMNALALAKLACAAHATIVLLPQFTAPAYIEAIGRDRCTWLTAVPPMIAMMLREKEALARTDLSSVEFIRMGSAPVSHALMEAIRHALPRASITNAYGTTEAGPVVFGPHPEGRPQPEMSVGYPHPKVQLRLIESDDMFVSGGENIYPADVERMLERHPDVAQAAVVPIDDEIKGQKPVAFVVPKPGRSPSEDEIKRFALANAPAYAHPRFVWFVDELPLASSNKIDRTLLHGLAQERLAGTTVK